MSAFIYGGGMETLPGGCVHIWSHLQGRLFPCLGSSVGLSLCLGSSPGGGDYLHIWKHLQSRAGGGSIVMSGFISRG